MPGMPLLPPLLLVLVSMIGMMIAFMVDTDQPPAIIPIIGIVSLAVILNATWLEFRRHGRRSRLPGWVLPFAGAVGGLAICAQLAIYLANSLQDEAVHWFLHVPGMGALLAVAAGVHVAWRG